MYIKVFANLINHTDLHTKEQCCKIMYLAVLKTCAGKKVISVADRGIIVQSLKNNYKTNRYQNNQNWGKWCLLNSRLQPQNNSKIRKSLTFRIWINLIMNSIANLKLLKDKVDLIEEKYTRRFLLKKTILFKSFK